MNAKRVATTGVVATAVSLLGATPSPVQQPPTLFARLEPGNYVALIGASESGARRIFHSSTWSTRGLSFSPSQRLLALIEVDSGPIDQTHPMPYRTRLVVIDTSGHVVRRIAREVQTFVWCGNDCLAIVVGAVDESDFGFSPAGTYIVHLDSDSATAVTRAPSARAVRWAPWDNAVFFQSAVVVRAQLPGGESIDAPYVGLDFSSGGRYYFVPSSEGNDAATFYDRATNQPLRVPELEALGDFVGWLADSGDYLLAVRRAPAPDVAPNEHLRVRLATPADRVRDADFIVYDLSTRRVVREVRGHQVRWVGPTGVFPIVHLGRIEAVRGP